MVVVVRHIETYGEMLEDVFTRYRIPHRFETGVPLLRVPFIKYWLALLDLVTSERSRESMTRVMSSAYFSPRLSPSVDMERTLAACGYIDRNHMRASVLAARKNSPLTAEIERFENDLDELERSQDTLLGFVNRLQPKASLSARDNQAWNILVEEISAVGAVYDGGKIGSRETGATVVSTGHRPSLQFAEFRRIASEIAGLRTVDRLTASPAAPGV